jgi:hypothetical protein
MQQIKINIIGAKFPQARIKAATRVIDAERPALNQALSARLHHPPSRWQHPQNSSTSPHRNSQRRRTPWRLDAKLRSNRHFHPACFQKPAQDFFRFPVTVVTRNIEVPDPRIKSSSEKTLCNLPASSSKRAASKSKPANSAASRSHVCVSHNSPKHLAADPKTTSSPARIPDALKSSA